MALNDHSLMPYGLHKDEKMMNVPAKYLIWLYENDKCNKDVRDYIEDCMDALKEEVRQLGENITEDEIHNF